MIEFSDLRPIVFEIGSTLKSKPDTFLRWANAWEHRLRIQYDRNLNELQSLSKDKAGSGVGASVWSWGGKSYDHHKIAAALTHAICIVGPIEPIPQSELVRGQIVLPLRHLAKYQLAFYSGLTIIQNYEFSGLPLTRGTFPVPVPKNGLGPYDDQTIEQLCLSHAHSGLGLLPLSNVFFLLDIFARNALGANTDAANVPVAFAQ